VYAPFEAAAIFLALAVALTVWSARSVPRPSEVRRT
jgi:hypothetical protein